MYHCSLLDPRPIPAAEEENGKIFQNPAGVLGLEVTVPALAERCTLGNIDPQHSGGNADFAAIEVAMTAELPPDGATLATIRPDVDSVGAMAVFSLRKQGITIPKDGIQMIAAADKFSRGDWPGVQPLPTKENPWPEATASASDVEALAPLAACVADFKRPLAERVQAMEEWLLHGEGVNTSSILGEYCAQVKKERLELISALEAGEINIRMADAMSIAVVKSTHRAATMLGYSQAPIVVALNPEFRVQGGEAHKKYTVCQYRTGYLNLGDVAEELTAKERVWVIQHSRPFGWETITPESKIARQFSRGFSDWRFTRDYAETVLNRDVVKKASPGSKFQIVPTSEWGGIPTIIGSPQGVGSFLDMIDVVSAVMRHSAAQRRLASGTPATAGMLQQVKQVFYLQSERRFHATSNGVILLLDSGERVELHDTNY